MLNFITNIDRSFENIILSLNNPTVESLFNIIAKLAGPTAVIIIALCIIYFLWRQDKTWINYFVWALIINEAAVFIIKIIVDRPRPLGSAIYNELDGSMPSGHAAASIFIYGFIIYLITKFWPKDSRRNWVIYSLLLLILLIGFSRLYLDVHFLSDVLAGYILGATTLYCLIQARGQN